jgi:hypothetical protein
MEGNSKVKWSLSFKIGNIKLFFMIAKIQVAKGLTSELPNGKHMFMVDMEKCGLETCVKSLRDTKSYYESTYKKELPDIFILSDSPNSFRAISFTNLTFRQLMELQCVTKHIDGLFIFYTALDKKGVLRISSKVGRNFPQNIVKIIEGSSNYKVPDNIIVRTYETSMEKKGIFIVLGEKKVEDLMK